MMATLYQAALALDAARPGSDLRPYQRDAVRAVAGRVLSGTVKRGLVAMPTGSGKTRVAAEVAGLVDGRVLMVAHREELVFQNAEAMRRANPSRDVGVVQAGVNQSSAQIVSASIQTLASEKRRRSIGDFGLVIIDEAHHALARSYIEVLTDLGCIPENGEAYTPAVGLTATPERSDRLALSQVWQEVVYRIGTIELGEQGYLAPMRTKRVLLDDLDLSAVKVRQGDFGAGELGEAMEQARAPEQIAQAWMESCADRRSTVVFVPTVSLAHEMAAAFSGLGVSASAIHGETPKDERRDLLARFRDGSLRVLANAMILTEGTDIPEIDCIVWARPTKSRPLIVQAVGRGLRLSPGKADCLVLDVAGKVRSATKEPVKVADLDGVTKIPDRQERLAAVRFGHGAEMSDESRLAWEKSLRESARARWLSSADKERLAASSETLRLIAIEGPRDGRFGAELIYTAEMPDGDVAKFSLAANGYRTEQACSLRESLFLDPEGVELTMELSQATSRRTGRTYYELTPVAAEDAA